MAEEYVESIIIRQDNKPEVSTPSFSDDDCDAIFEFEGKIKLTGINKAIQNATHNRHDYVFTILSIDKMQKEE
ncbi:hypothetical protein LCGC14_0960660 [marine sediment metagenome]|uniref:Uncharacterized protein n=1 Tax=marine sediment metagenome TaxID=412755 RepID=A0A0F9RL48_9ZZZZ